MTERAAAADIDRDNHRCLVMGFDYSEGAEIALDHALSLVGCLPAGTLHVVWVLPTTASEARNLPEATRRLRAYVASRVRFSSNRLGPRAVYGGVQIHVHVLVGSPAPILNDVAFREGAHLLVLGCHGRAGLERVVLGCVAADVLATAPCPVVVARPRAVEQLARRRGRLPDALSARQGPLSSAPWSANSATGSTKAPSKAPTKGLSLPRRPELNRRREADSRRPEDASHGGDPVCGSPRSQP
jgi:nucleotide-binding universal stress UspA family protein